jgi:pilus assembly protein CpaE
MNSPLTKLIINNVLIVNDGLSSDSAVEDIISLSPSYSSLTVEFGKTKTLEEKYIPRIIVLDVHDFAESEIVVLKELQQRFEDTPLIVVSDAMDDGQIRQLIKLQVHDWFRKPLNKQLFQSALETGIQSKKITSSRVHAVVSAVGGAGATSFAVGLADMLAQRMKKVDKSVALFDLDFSTGNCSYILNMTNEYNLDTVVNTPSRIDAEFINIIKQKHTAGFDVISFKRPDLLTQIHGFELVLRMLDVISIQHDHTILDIPYYATDWGNEVFSEVNTMTIVSELNLPTIKHTLEMVQQIKAQRGDNFPIQIVFNKIQRRMFGQRISSKQIKELFGDLAVIKIAKDEDGLQEAINRGVLVSEVNERSPFLNGVKKYMNKYIIPKGGKDEKKK